MFNQAIQLREALSLRGKLRPKACLHVSLIGFGRWPGSSVALADVIGAALKSVRVDPFNVTLDCAMSFAGQPNQRPFVLCSEARIFHLQALYENLVDALKAAKLIASAPRILTPHVTLLYDNQRIERRNVAPMGWTVKDIVLVQSFVGQARHAVVRRWPLLSDEATMVA